MAPIYGREPTLAVTLVAAVAACALAGTALAMERPPRDSGPAAVAGETGAAEEGGIAAARTVCPGQARAAACREQPPEAFEAPRPGIPGGKERLLRLKRQGTTEHSASPEADAE